MERVDRNNAHVRKGRTDAPSAEAEEASRLLQDPAFVRAHTRIRNGLIAEIEGHKADGSRESEEFQLEACRALRTLACLRRAIGLAEQNQSLRDAGFRPQIIQGDGE